MSGKRFKPRNGEIWLMIEEGTNRVIPRVVVSESVLRTAELKYHSQDSDIDSVFFFDWMNAGLTKKTVVKLGNERTYSIEKFTRRIGRLSRTDLAKLMRKYNISRGKRLPV